MTIVYVIIVYGFFGQMKEVLPGSYTSLDHCSQAIATMVRPFGTFPKCEPLTNHGNYKHTH